MVRPTFKITSLEALSTAVTIPAAVSLRMLSESFSSKFFCSVSKLARCVAAVRHAVTVAVNPSTAIRNVVAIRPAVIGSRCSHFFA